MAEKVKAKKKSITKKIIEKKKNPGRKKIMQKYIDLRKKLFPSLTDELIWHSSTNDGWRNIPRCMTYIMNIMDDLCSGSPPSSTYLALWLRSYESYFLKELNFESLASESNLTGQRAVTTLKKKLENLKELGFILEVNKFGAIAIPNPYLVIEKLRSDGKVTDDVWSSLIMRMSDVGEKSF